MKPSKTFVSRGLAALAVVAGGTLLLAQPARADSLSIALNLGGGGYYHAYEPVVYRPVVRQVVYRPAPVRVARVVYKDVHHGKHWGKHGHDRRNAWRGNGWHRGHRVAYGYR